MKDSKIYFRFAIFLIISYELLANAWISDDAAITLRTVENIINGNGVVFNVGERVQAYTHPLWLAILTVTTWFTGNVLISAYLTPFVLTLLFFWFFLSKISRASWVGIYVSVALLCSHAFMDFAGSGLENPLSHIVVLSQIYFASRFLHERTINYIWFFFIAESLAYLTRPDLILVSAPLYVLILVECRSNIKPILKPAMVSSLPVLMWMLWSLYYYGFPFPNTAYAKLGSGISSPELVGQGIIYLKDSICHDPLTFMLICLSFLVSMRVGSVDRALLAGIALYIFYTIRIGGDFMSGRFMTVPLVASAAIISRLEMRSNSISRLPVAALLFGIVGISVILNDKYFRVTEIDPIQRIINTGIADEKSFYFNRTGLINVGRAFFKLPNEPAQSKSVETTCGGLGFRGLYGGSSLHLIDICGLSDALLARLPAKQDDLWRIGHFARQIPENYYKTIKYGRNLLVDDDAKNLYSKLNNIIAGDLNDPKRLREIIDINLGSSLGEFDKYRYGVISQESGIPAIDSAKVLTQQLNELPRSGDQIVRFSGSIDVVLKTSTFIRGLDVSLDPDDSYIISTYFNGNFTPYAQVGPKESYGGDILALYQNISSTLKAPIDRIRITGKGGDGTYALGQLKIHTGN